MTSDFKLFMVAPKFLLATGTILTAPQIAVLVPGLKRITPYLWAPFGDVLIANGRLMPGFDNLAGVTLRSGNYIPLHIDGGIDLTGATNKALLVILHHAGSPQSV
jgi:hypothetical protein